MINHKLISPTELVRGRREYCRPNAKSRTISAKHTTQRELELGRMMYPDAGHERPKTRGDCIAEGGPHAQRPCPWVSCRHHLYLEHNPTNGSFKMNFPDLEVWEMKVSCSLDVADDNGDGLTLEEVGVLMNLTRERVRNLEGIGMRLTKQAIHADQTSLDSLSPDEE